MILGREAAVWESLTPDQDHPPARDSSLWSKSQRRALQALPAVLQPKDHHPFLGGDSDKVNQTAISRLPPPLSSLRQLAASQQQDAAFKPPWSCQGSLTDQSLTEITPFWLHKGGLFHRLGMHVTSEGERGLSPSTSRSGISYH